jgi:low affinity Fe/Cu permease
MAGNPLTFTLALIILLIWLMIGIFFGFSNTWLLVIDTLATVNAALMVFILQNTQIRESKALHLKIDELLRVAQETEKGLIAIEQKEEEELEKIRRKISKQK